jgi:hypothetical protein
MLTLSKRYLELELTAQHRTGAQCVENRNLGFIPAFMDTRTGEVNPSTDAHGRPSPFHVLDGLPVEFVVARDRHGRPSHVVGTLVPGFVRDNCFYTREQATEHVSRAIASPALFAR